MKLYMRKLCVLVMLALPACATGTAERAKACEANLSSVVALPSTYIGKKFCGHAILEVGHLLAFAKPVERPGLTESELAIKTIDMREYEKYGLRVGKSYRVYIEGVLEGDPRCFVESDDVCTPYPRQLFLYPEKLTILAPL